MNKCILFYNKIFCIYITINKFSNHLVFALNFINLMFFIVLFKKIYIYKMILNIINMNIINNSNDNYRNILKKHKSLCLLL